MVTGVWLRGSSFVLFKQKTAYEMRISDWSSDVCSSDLQAGGREMALLMGPVLSFRGWNRKSNLWQLSVLIVADEDPGALSWRQGTGRLTNKKIGRASGRERVCK